MPWINPANLPAIEVINAGRGGNSSNDLLRRVDKDVLGREPTLTIVLVGTNDALNSKKLLPVEDFEINLSKLVQRIQQKNSTVILVTPPPCLTSLLLTRHSAEAYGDSLPDARLESISTAIRKVGSKNDTIVVDFYKELKLRKSVHDGPSSLIRNPENSKATDGVHPTASGYKLLAQMIHDAIISYRLDTKNVICFGDSITFGSSVKGAGTATGDTYPAKLREFIQRTTREPLILNRGGTENEPAVFDGRGMVIDLGKDISHHEWKKQEGDLWISQPDLLAKYELKPVIAGQVAGLFVGEIPISIPRDLEAEKLHPDRKSRCYLSPAKLKPGQMGYFADGSIYFRWPAGIKPGQSRGRGKFRPIILPPKPGTNGVSIACSHIVVRNVTAVHAANDGFNIHGDRRGIQLENVRALSNADEGISAHETTEMKVDGAEVAFNGSTAGGIADVNESMTHYQNCIVHNNAGAAFFFSGKSHSVIDTLIYSQSRDFTVADKAGLKKERVEWLTGTENEFRSESKDR